MQCSSLLGCSSPSISPWLFHHEQPSPGITLDRISLLQERIDKWNEPPPGASSPRGKVEPPPPKLPLMSSDGPESLCSSSTLTSEELSLTLLTVARPQPLAIRTPTSLSTQGTVLGIQTKHMPSLVVLHQPSIEERLSQARDAAGDLLNHLGGGKDLLVPTMARARGTKTHPHCGECHLVQRHRGLGEPIVNGPPHLGPSQALQAVLF